MQAFKTNIQPSIDKTCAFCHTTQQRVKLVKADADSSHTSLLKWTKNDADRLFNFISNKADAKHKGGDQSAALKLEKIQAWVKVEVDCGGK